MSKERPDAAKIPIIAQSANAFKEDVQASLDSGMNGHISKPFNIDAVTTAIKQNIKRQQIEQQSDNYQSIVQGLFGRCFFYAHFAERRCAMAAGEHVDSKNIKKHKNDVFRLKELIDPTAKIVAH